MKKCTRSTCKIKTLQPLTNFFKDKARKDGHATICKVCRNETAMLWREQNKDKYNEYMRGKDRDRRLKARLQPYGVANEQYHKMHKEQRGMCKICGKPPQVNRPLVPDQRHDSKKVRGLLCYGCNRAIAILDNPELLAKAVAYLEIK